MFKYIIKKILPHKWKLRYCIYGNMFYCNLKGNNCSSIEPVWNCRQSIQIGFHHLWSFFGAQQAVNQKCRNSMTCSHSEWKHHINISPFWTKCFEGHNKYIPYIIFLPRYSLHICTLLLYTIISSTTVNPVSALDTEHTTNRSLLHSYDPDINCNYLSAAISQYFTWNVNLFTIFGLLLQQQVVSYWFSPSLAILKSRGQFSAARNYQRKMGVLSSRLLWRWSYFNRILNFTNF